MVARIQYQKSAIRALTSISCNFDTPTTTGNFVVVVVVSDSTISLAGSPAGFTELTNSNSSPYTKVFYYPNASSQSNITVSFDSSTNGHMFIIEYSNINTTLPLDTSSFGYNYGGYTNNITTSTAVELILGIVGIDTTSYFSSPGNGFSIIDSITDITQPSSCLTELITSSSGNYTSTVSPTGGGTWQTGIMAFKGSAGGGGGGSGFIGTSTRKMIIPRRGKGAKF